VYLRLGNSLLLTYFMSAFWHGFYPGYYLFFFSIAFVTIVTRQWQKTITPRFSSGGPFDSLYSFITIVGFSIYVNYYSIVFQVLAWEYSIAVWKGFLFLGHIITVVAYVIASIVPAPKAKGKKA